MDLLVLRCVFLAVALGTAVSLCRAEGVQNTFQVFISVMGVAITCVFIDIMIKRKSLQLISSIYFGAIVGVFLSYVLVLVFESFLVRYSEETRAAITLVLGVCMIYLSTSVLMQTRSDFRLIIPFVEFSRDVKGLKPLILDTSVIVDGRIADVVAALHLDNQIIIPQFVINELQAIADSPDRLKRNRGRRGLDVLKNLRSNTDLEVIIPERDAVTAPGISVDQKLVVYARDTDGKLVTNDFNLNKIAQAQGVPVLNINALTNSLKPVCLPGEELDVLVVKQGESESQGVGYLEDGTMVVIEGGRDHIGKDVHISVTSVLQKSAGRMIFGKFEYEVGNEPAES